VGGAIKQKGIEAPNIENKMEDCEECTATLSFYVTSGSDLSQVHMVVENLRVTGDIPDEGGCDRRMTDGDTSGEGVWATNMSPSTHRRMTTSGDTSGEGVWATNMSPSTNRRIMMIKDTSEKRCVGHEMSSSSDRLMTIGRDTSDGRCEDHDMSPSSDRLMKTGGDTSGEGVRTMI